MTKDDLKNITLDTTVYHPYLGAGNPIQITPSKVHIRFIKSNNVICFVTSGGIGTDRFVEEIYLQPVEIRSY